MKLSRWFTTSFTIKRFTNVVDSGGVSTNAQSTIGTILGHKYPVSGMEVDVKDKKEGQTYWKILTTVSADVLYEDTLETSSEKFEVVNLLPRNVGLNPHLEILAREIE